MVAKPKALKKPEYGKCLLCEERFRKWRPKDKFCSQAHRMKWHGNIRKAVLEEIKKNKPLKEIARGE